MFPHTYASQPPLDFRKTETVREKERGGRERNREEKKGGERTLIKISSSLNDLIGWSPLTYHCDSERPRKRKRKEEEGPSGVCPTVVHRTMPSSVAQSCGEVKIKSLSDFDM